MEQFLNRVWATLATGMDAVQTALPLTTGHGARFGTIAAGNKIRIVLLDASNNVSEVMYLTAISGDTGTVARAQDGTTATTHLAGDRLEVRIGKSTMDTMRQPIHIQQGAETLLGSVAGVDTITAAANPTLTAQMATGSKWKFLAAGANTGAAATINVDGMGAVSLLRPDGTALQANDIPAASYPCQIQKRASDAILLNPANLLPQQLYNANPAGKLIEYAGTTAPSGYLVCPTAQTNISRTTYAALFAAIGTTWGAGDGATTFGMPWFPADYASVQANANVGTQTVGAVISHTHTQAWSVGASGTTTSGSGLTPAPGPTGATGGSANLAAGVRVLKCVKY